MVPARAQLEVYEHQYVPPVEVAPVAFALIFDLEIPVEARCGEAKELVRAALIDAARTSIEREDPRPEIVELPSVEVAVKDGVPCRQENERHFDANSYPAHQRALRSRRGRPSGADPVGLRLEPGFAATERPGERHLPAARAARRNARVGAAHARHRAQLRGGEHRP
jgi:hypothetical protein